MKIPVYLTLLLLFISPFNALFGQVKDTVASRHSKRVIKRPAKRNAIWFTPTRAREINGITIGTIPSSVGYDNDSLHINGIHIETNPIMFMLFPYVIIGSLSIPFHDLDSTNSMLFNFSDSVESSSNNVIKGLNISILGSAEMTHYRGVSISSLATFGRSLKGISMTVGLNNFYEFHGLLIAGLANNAYKGTGIQIGLINRCTKCKVIQIGLINKIGKRILPFFNASL